MRPKNKRKENSRTQQHFRHCEELGRRTQDRNPLCSKLNPASVSSTFCETQEEACSRSGTLVAAGGGVPCLAAAILVLRVKGREKEEEEEKKEEADKEDR